MDLSFICLLPLECQLHEGRVLPVLFTKVPQSSGCAGTQEANTCSGAEIRL